MKKISFLLILALLSVTALASAEEPSASSTQEQKQAQPSSSVMRENKTWGFLGEAGSFTIGGMDSFGVGGGLQYFLNSNNVLSLEFGAGTNYDFVSSISANTVNGYDSREGIYFQHFTNNSFYLKGGIEFTQMNYNVVHYPLSGAYYSQTATLNVDSVYLGLGNQWQFNKLTLGCDWAAVLIPFANNGYNEVDSGPVYSAWSLQSQLTAPRVEFGRFYIGMTF